jgi:colanic acid biosynthesis glycosyl transferase WcaI
MASEDRRLIVTASRSDVPIDTATDPATRPRLVVHDFAGHPFQVQLSRALAARGATVLHLHCGSDVTPKGSVQAVAGDALGFSVEGIWLRTAFDKYRIQRRLLQEVTYGRAVARRIREFGPDAVISSNAPLFAQGLIRRAAARSGARFVFWQQDVLSAAMTRFCAERIPFGGRALAGAFTMLERRIAQKSDAVVPISGDFLPLLRAWGVEDVRISVIENWAPLDEIPVHPRDNAWSDEHGLQGLRTFLYAGTLGMKHNPELLLKLAERFSDVDDVRVVVVSEGRGAEWLRAEIGSRGLTNLTVMPYQPYLRLPEVLASGDVLVVLLESAAGAFSVPSKVLSYFCAGRALVAAVPPENLAARTIRDTHSGAVVDPSDAPGFVAAAEHLLDDADCRLRAGEMARSYAELRFRVDVIADRFIDILHPRFPVRTAYPITTS